MRLLMAEPNVLLLDEPTNDLDIDTLTALEDLLDGWPGTLIVVSHDRYFVERVCDNVYALTQDGAIRHLPGGIDQYIELLASADEPVRARPIKQAKESRQASAAPTGPEMRTARKEIKRIERELDRISVRQSALQDEMTQSASDHTRLATLNGESQAIAVGREQLEAAWLGLAQLLEDGA